MRALVEYFVRRPLLVNIIVIAVVFNGIKSLFTIQKEGFPSVSINEIIINTTYPGASAHDVELNVTMKIEDELKEVSGIKEIISVSKENLSTINVVADEDATRSEFRKIYDDVDGAVSRITDLPSDIEGRPTLKQVTTDDVPIIELAVSGNEQELRPFVEFLEKRLLKIDGVTGVETIGLSDEEVEILVNPQGLKKHELGLNQIAESIRKRNIEGSGGTMESFIGEKKIVSVNKFTKPEDVLDTVLRRSFEGFGVDLGDIASLRTSQEDLKLSVFNNGYPGVSLLVKKGPRDDVIQTIDAILETVNNVEKPSSITISHFNDQSKFTRERLKLLSTNALIGMVLVMAILFLIFDWRTASWTVFGIPFSILGVFAVLPYTGVVLSTISLGGFVLVLGILVDDAIVVSEQINQYKEAGMPFQEAAIKGVQKIWKPVLASSVTTVIAFSPLLQFGGYPGKFVWVIPLVVLLSLAISLFESYFILPAHLCHVAHAKKPEKTNLVLKINRVYNASLEWALKFRYAVVFGFIGIFAVTVITAKKFLIADPFPQDSAESFLIQVTQPISYGEKSSRVLLEKIEKEISGLSKAELLGFSTRLGTLSKEVVTERGTQSNLATIFVYLTPFSERDRNAEEIVTSIREKILPLAGNRYSIFTEVIRIGPPLGRPFEVRVGSNDNPRRDKVVGEVKKYLATLPGVYDIDDDVLEGKTEVNLKINYKKLAELELTVEDVVSTIRIAYDGQIVSDIIDHDKTVDFRLRLNRESRSDLDFVKSLSVLNRSGRLIPLKVFATTEEQPSKAEIRHIDGIRTTAVFGQLDKNLIGPGEVIDQVSKNFSSEPGLDITYSGEPIENQKIFGDLKIAALTAVLGIYLVIALIFNSYAKPFIIMSAIPFVLVGMVFAMVSHGLNVSIFAMMALIGLMGIIVNDSIVMIYSILDLAGTKNVTIDVIREGAVTRIRPILLTTFTTVLGLFPTAYAIGGYDPFISPMCLAMAYGLLFGIFVVLFLVPSLYAILLDIGSLKSKGTRAQAA